MSVRSTCLQVQESEVILEEPDVSKAIIDYIAANKIQSIALGASNRNAFTKKWKNPDVPSSLMKGAPDYCNIYVVAKGKPVNVRLAKCGVPADDSDFVFATYSRRSSRSQLPPMMPLMMPESISCSRRSIDRPELTTRPPFRERSLQASATKPLLLSGRIDSSTLRSNSHDPSSLDPDFAQAMHFSSMDFGENLDALSLSPRESGSPLPAVSSSYLPACCCRSILSCLRGGGTCTRPSARWRPR